MVIGTTPAIIKEARVAILSGLGLNCDYETEHAFKRAGAKVDRILINRLMQDPKQLDNYDMLVFQGGFSAGDHLGSGKYVAKLIEHNQALFDKIKSFAGNPRKLIMGVCNGFQILTNLGLLPGALSFNEEKSTARAGCFGQFIPKGVLKTFGKINEIINPSRYQNRWVDLKVANRLGPWFNDIIKLPLPIAHGEGRYVRAGEQLVQSQIALQYDAGGSISRDQRLSYNPNGSEDDIAAITNEKGNVLGMMPHPERAIYAMHHPDWGQEKELLSRFSFPVDHKQHTYAFKIITNAVKFLQSA